MEPKALNIQELAIYDPVAAYGICLGIPRIPISMNCAGIFSSFAVPQIPVEGDLDTTIAQRTWIDNITYSLQQPNVFAGNIFKTLYDTMLKQAPGISCQIQVQSGPRYLVSPQFTPLENVAPLLQQHYPAGWPLFKQQSIEVNFMLTPGSLTSFDRKSSKYRPCCDRMRRPAARLMVSTRSLARKRSRC